MNCMWSANGDFKCKKQQIEHYANAPIPTASTIDGRIKNLEMQKRKVENELKNLDNQLDITKVQSDTLKHIRVVNNNTGNVPDGPYLKNCSGCKLEHDKILSCEFCDGEKTNGKLYVPVCNTNSITVLNKKLVCSST